MTTTVVNAMAEKYHYKAPDAAINNIQSFIAASGGNTYLQPYRNPNSKKPDFLVFIIRNWAFLFNPLKLPSTSQIIVPNDFTKKVAF